jgi:hypothetical protein
MSDGEITMEDSFRGRESDIAPEDMLNPKKNLKTSNYYISGTFSNWGVRKMYPLSEFISFLEGCDSNGL